MEPHVCKINRGPALAEEWVSIWNGGNAPVSLTGLELTDYTQTQRHVHVIRFPAYTDGTPITLLPREVAFVFTGHGQNAWRPRRNGGRELWLFAGRSAPVWNNDGDVAYLRHVETGEFVDSMTVGSPPRHPNGH
jgi:Lamin Tail Domain